MQAGKSSSSCPRKREGRLNKKRDKRENWGWRSVITVERGLVAGVTYPIDHHAGGMLKGRVCTVFRSNSLLLLAQPD